MHPVLRKLSTFATFSNEEAHAIENAFTSGVDIRAGALVAREDERPDHVIFLLDGFLCRQKLMPNGNRQILSFILPGDACDIGVSVVDKRDHSLLAMTQSRVARISDPALECLMGKYPRVRAAFRWATMQSEGIFREWIVNVAQRMAVSRIAHLFCEVYYLADAIGLASGKSLMLPLTQTDLGDAVGISPVHVNRSLQELRKRGLVTFGDKRLTILDLPRLEDVAEMDPTYLHLTARYDEPAKVLVH